MGPPIDHEKVADGAPYALERFERALLVGSLDWHAAGHHGVEVVHSST